MSKLEDVLVTFQIFHDNSKLEKFKKDNAVYWVDYHKKALIRINNLKRNLKSRICYHEKQIKKYEKLLKELMLND